MTIESIDTDATPRGNVSIRPATGGDLTGLLKLIRPYVTANRLLPRTTRELRDLLPSGFVAEVNGDVREIVGFAALEIYSPKLAEVRSLAVRPDHQGHGIGRQLVDACVDRARRKRVLEVMAITSEEQFFKHCGFDFTLPGEKKALFIQTRETA